eukprot:4991880-Karenia_brevis.AAC.1
MNITEDPSYEHHRRSFLRTPSKTLLMSIIEAPSYELSRVRSAAASAAAAGGARARTFSGGGRGGKGSQL